MNVMQFQLIACEINLSGDRDNTVVKSQYDPITLPELMVLRHIHGGDEHVYDRVAVGVVERTVAEERERLSLKYDRAVVDRIFPISAGLPTADASLPTLEEVEAAAKAAAEAAAAVRSQRTAPKKTKPAPVEPVVEPAPDVTAVPDLSALPSA